jgi:uracil phosphoribosyltransferase
VRPVEKSQFGTGLTKQGGSATMAVEVLKSKGVPEDRILFLNLIASPSGVAEFAQKFPRLRVVTAFIDQGLNEKKSVSPGPFATHRASAN